MIQVEYSFCSTRLFAMGLTLPWQLVAAQDPGPTYLSFPMTFEAPLSFCANTAHGKANETKSAAHSATEARRGLFAILIRGYVRLDSLYLLSAKEVKEGGRKFMGCRNAGARGCCREESGKRCGTDGAGCGAVPSG